MTEAVVKCLKHAAALSNSNLLRNTDSLLCKKKTDVNIEWVGASNRTAPTWFKLSY